MTRLVGGRARKVAVDRRTDMAKPLYLGETAAFWAWCLALLYMTAPLEIIISGSDPDRGMTNPLPIYNITRLMVGLVAAYFATRQMGKLRALLFELWPYVGFYAVWSLYSIFILEIKSILLADASIFGGLVVTVAAAMHLGPRRYGRAVFYMLLLAIAVSLATVVIMPNVGIHSGIDKSGGAGGAGQWRGAYIHKNYLGHLSGITAGLLISFGTYYLKRLWIWVLALASSVLCMVMSHSSSAIVLIAAVPAIYYSIVAARGWAKVGSIGSTVFLVMVFVPYRDNIISYGLEMVGKGQDLSGRSSIWRIAESILTEHFWLGGGLSYTSTVGFQDRIRSLFQVNNVHNAYLDTAINYGVVGAALFYGAILYVVSQSWLSRLPSSLQRPRAIFTLLLAAWLVSSLSEIMAVRSYGVIAQIGVTALVGLAAVTNEARVGRRSRRARSRSRSDREGYRSMAVASSTSAA